MRVLFFFFVCPRAFVTNEHVCVYIYIFYPLGNFWWSQFGYVRHDREGKANSRRKGRTNIFLTSLKKKSYVPSLDRHEGAKLFKSMSVPPRKIKRAEVKGGNLFGSLCPDVWYIIGKFLDKHSFHSMRATCTLARNVLTPKIWFWHGLGTCWRFTGREQWANRPEGISLAGTECSFVGPHFQLENKDLSAFADAHALAFHHQKNITDEGLSCLENVQVMHFRGSDLNDGDIGSLKKLKRLRKLRLWNAYKVSGRAIGKIMQLQQVTLSGCFLTDKDLMFIGQMPNLVSLNIEGNPWITGEGVAHLCNMTHLAADRCCLNDDDLMAFAGLLRLTMLEFDCQKILGHGLLHLQHVKWLRLWSNVTIVKLKHLLHLPKLCTLSVPRLSIEFGGIFGEFHDRGITLKQID